MSGASGRAAATLSLSAIRVTDLAKSSSTPSRRGLTYFGTVALAAA
ncbi:hypothetical protein AB0H60_11040 [Nocardia rhamnosiphila]